MSICNEIPAGRHKCLERHNDSTIGVSNVIRDIPPNQTFSNVYLIRKVLGRLHMPQQLQQQHARGVDLTMGALQRSVMHGSARLSHKEIGHAKNEARHT